MWSTGRAHVPNVHKPTISEKLVSFIARGKFWMTINPDTRSHKTCHIHRWKKKSAASEIGSRYDIWSASAWVWWKRPLIHCHYMSSKQRLTLDSLLINQPDTLNRRTWQKLNKDIWDVRWLYNIIYCTCI